MTTQLTFELQPRMMYRFSHVTPEAPDAE